MTIKELIKISKDKKILEYNSITQHYYISYDREIFKISKIREVVNDGLSLTEIRLFNNLLKEI